MLLVVVKGVGSVTIRYIDVFRFLRKRPSWRNKVAAIVVIRHLTCPHCSAIQGAMTLGRVVERVDPNMFVVSSGVASGFNPEFRETHLSNPLKCSVCGKTFYAFVGVEYDPSSRTVRNVDVQVVRSDMRGIEQILNWPHQGLVMREVIEYTPFQARVYDSLEHFEEYNKNNMQDIVISSLINGTGTVVRPQNGTGNGSEPVVVELEAR